MTENTCRLARLFYCLISALVLFALPARCAEPNKTVISDTLYRADGAPARGTLLISWPAFSTSDGRPVAAGRLSVKIASNGSVNIALVPTQGAMPSGTAYKIVLSLDDGSTSTEYWSVPEVSPTTIAAIRSMQVPATVATQVVSREYVDAQLATVVRKNGDETVTGNKTFASSPLVPTPVTNAAAANKGYVDTAIAAAAASSATSYGAWSAYLQVGIQSTITPWSQWVAPANLTITRIVAIATQAGMGTNCSTQPSIYVQDTTGSANSAHATFGDESNLADSSAMSFHVAAGHALQIKSAGAGCSSMPAGINITVSYTVP